MPAIRPTLCERTRAYVSLRLDGELAELEQRMLDAHLHTCEACSTYGTEVQAITEAVRTAPLEAPGRPAWTRFRQPRTGWVRQLAAVAAGLLVVVGAGTFAQRGDDVSEERHRSPAAWPAPKMFLSETALLQEQSLMALTRPGNPLPQLRF